jgi:hypothetical protein
MGIEHGEPFQDPYRFDSEAEPPKKPRGCFFYGCIAASVLALLMAIAIGVAGYFARKAYFQFIEQNTSTTRMALPKVEMPEEQRKALGERFDAFKEALDRGEDVEPLVLNGDELNVLLQEKGGTKDRVYFVIEGDTLKGQVSLPLDEFKLPGLQGRYFNGKATFHASLRGGVLVVTAESGEINGRPISEQFMAGIRGKNLAEDAAKNPDNAALIRKLESIQVKDGKIIITPKSKDERAPRSAPKEEPSDDQPKAKGEAPPPDEEKAKDAPATKEPEKAPAPPDPAKKAETPAEKATP